MGCSSSTSADYEAKVQGHMVEPEAGEAQLYKQGSSVSTDKSSLNKQRSSLSTAMSEDTKSSLRNQRSSLTTVRNEDPMPRRVSWDSEVNVEEFVMHEKSIGQELDPEMRLGLRSSKTRRGGSKDSGTSPTSPTSPTPPTPPTGSTLTSAFF
mmetsp:Transcript_60281/g.122435  ORF Transcript_60281/g.122435 Transcript_60281/m.122435 type:complete len:152 (-) Transcript_60281:291-746(-)